MYMSDIHSMLGVTLIVVVESASDGYHVASPPPSDPSPLLSCFSYQGRVRVLSPVTALHTHNAPT